MISKETFCKALELIQEQQAVNKKVSDALELVGNGYFAFSGGEQYYEALMLVLKDASCDKYDYISWWLYEATPEYKVWSADHQQEWRLKEPGDLYDFIRDECQD